MDDALLKSLGDEAVGVDLGSLLLRRPSTPPSNKRFVAAMAKDYGVLPGGYSAGMYVAGQCVEAALGKTRRQVRRQARRSATRCTACRSTDTPRGPVNFDQYGNVVGDGVHPPLRAQGRQLVNTTIKTYPNVSQFWTYPTEEFLAQPVYSRDYPPAKNLQ